ncbi:MAG: hypothetical protein ACM34B_07740 [Nitrospira sp.]
MLYRWRATNLLLICVLLCLTPVIDPAQVSALPVTYELVSGTDLTGHFTYDAATLSLTDYEITSAFHSVTWNATPISEAFGPNGFFIADHAFSGTSVYLLELFARVDTLSFQGRACLEPFCSYNHDSRGTLAVPEASSDLLLLLGGVLLLWMLRAAWS